MSKILCSSLVFFCLLFSTQSMSVDSSSYGNFIDFALVDIPVSSPLEPPASVTACCDAQGDGAYCNQFLMFLDRFDMWAGYTDCPTAGIRVSPGYNPTNCAYRYGEDWCHFALRLSGKIKRRIRIFKSVITLIKTRSEYEYSDYASQSGATGWPGNAGASTWGFNGSGLNFANPGNSVTNQAVLVQPEDACSPITNASELVGKTAVMVRGSCEFGTQILRAQNAGAASAVVTNNVASDIFAMSAGTDGSAVTIPAVFIPRIIGQKLRAGLAAGDWVEITVGNIS